MTSYGFPEYRNAAYASGAKHFLTKGTATMTEIASLLESLSHNGNGISQYRTNASRVETEAARELSSMPCMG